MNLSFKGLIREALGEITGRCPEYFSRYGIEFAPVEAIVGEYASHPLFAERLHDGLAHALRAGASYLQEQGLPVSFNCVQEDGISVLLTRSILDAYAAAQGSIPLKPAQAEEATLADVLRGRYSLSMTEGGIRFARAKDGGRALLLICSPGMPLEVWRRLLCDGDIGRSVLVVESRAGPLVEGGSPRQSDLYGDVEDIRAVLKEERLSEVDVVAWCNGARVGIELARGDGGLVRSLVLISPTFHGAVDARQYPSPFEDSLPNVYRVLNEDPRRGQYLLRCLAQVTPTGDSLAGKKDPARRTKLVLNSHPHALSRELFLPLSTVDDFRHYIERISSDERYDVAAAIPQVRCPVLLLTGTHDAAISTDAARDVLSRHGRDVLSATVFGAGHHVHVLQYSYFRSVLDTFLSRGALQPTVRVQIDRLAG